MKLCPKCRLEKHYEDFYKCKKNVDGLQSYCKSCIKSANTSWAEANKEKFKEYDRKFRQTEKRQQYLEQYKTQNEALLREKRKQYKEKNSEKTKASNKLYQTLNKERVEQSRKNYYEANKGVILAKAKEYRARNKPRYAKHSSLRRAAERRAQPTWLTSEDLIRMELVWGLRELKSFVSGEEYEVDHIVPLRGATVCGLHVPWNLRVIPKIENRRKHARYWPNMWE